MKTTTLNKIRECKPCSSGWVKLLNNLGKTCADDEPLSFMAILDSNGFDDALWCCRAASEYDKEWRLFTIWCARRNQHLINDHRAIAALDMEEKFVNGECDITDLDPESILKIRTKWSPGEAAWTTARAEALAAERAALAAWAAWAAEAAGAAGAAGAAEREAQKQQFIKIISE